jgi:hypothetical protein
MINRIHNSALSRIAAKHRVAVLALGLGIVGAGGVLASAASLGLTQTGSLGTGTQVIASCDTDGVNVNYNTTFSTSTGLYEVTSATITGIDSKCELRTLKITLRKTVAGNPGSFNAVANGTATLDNSGAATVALIGVSGLDASMVDSAAISIS